MFHKSKTHEFSGHICKNTETKTQTHKTNNDM